MSGPLVAVVDADGVAVDATGFDAADVDAEAATDDAALLVVVVPSAAAALATAVAFGSVVAAVVAGAEAMFGPAELNVLRPPGSVVDISFTPPKKLMFDWGEKGLDIG